jgi:hypothetical protein
MESTKAGAQNQINSMRISPRPSILETGLKIVGAGLNAGSSYYAMKNPTPRRG